jgi:fatty-acyl-CoA synthase
LTDQTTTLTATVQTMLRARSADPREALLFGRRRWSWRAYVAECAARAKALLKLRDPRRPFHVGLLMDNTPEMAMALGAAGLGGFVAVGLNTTRRGAGLARDTRLADCQFVLTDQKHIDLLDGLDLGGARVVDVSNPSWFALVDVMYGGDLPSFHALPDDLFMLIFTSGTSGEPKAVRITHEKVCYPAQYLAQRLGITAEDRCYISMPLFHSNSVMAGWGPALAAGATMALGEKFSASGFIDDVRRYGATYMNYVGKALSYALATPVRPVDANNTLRLAFGNEASEKDIAAFGMRFRCQVIDGFGSTENAVTISRTPDTPPGSLGVPWDGVAVLNPDTGLECRRALLGRNNELLNPEEAIGELVNTAGPGQFAGYYNDDEATAERMRGGMYWSGDLAYRDMYGYIYYAGRTSDWMRVDGENLAAGPIERILLRHPDINRVAVYGIPDPSVGDRVMAAIVLQDGALFGSTDFEKFLASQPDLGTKMWPRYVRVSTSLPSTASNKVLKRTLIRQGLDAGYDHLWVRQEWGTSYSRYLWGSNTI